MALRRRWTRHACTLLLLCIGASALVSGVAAFTSYRNAPRWSLFHLENLVGQTSRSIAEGNGLTVATDVMGTPGNVIVFRGARMPLPSYVVAGCATLFGEHALRSAALLKSFLLLLPVWMSMLLVFRATLRSTQPGGAFAVLLVLPFMCPVFLADVVNLQVEEGYTYSLIALAFALLLLTPIAGGARFAGLPRGVALAATLGLLYLTKSSMLPVVMVLAAAAFVRLPSTWARCAIAIVLAASIGGWAAHQKHATGRYSAGTSLDALNLHKGNYEGFAASYPPPPGVSLDREESSLSAGHSFPNEWQFSDFHLHAALGYASGHRAETLRSAFTKAWVFFLSVQRYGSSVSTGPARLAETLGMVLFRLLLLAALVTAALGTVTGGGPGRFAGAVFLAMVAACALPYLAGFAYTRHASVLLLPSSLLLCRALLSEADLAAA